MSTTITGSGNGINASRANATFYSTTELSGNAAIANLTSGVLWKWGGGIGAGLTLTFSFNTGNGQSAYNSSYPNDYDSVAAGITANQQTGALSVMAQWAAVANITFSQIIDSPTQAGDLRWTNTTGSTSTAFGYYPYSGYQGGDMWFGPNYDAYKNPVVGEYGYLTFLHELGHALGLNHPHDADPSSPAVNGQDQLKYSVMSYRDFAGDAMNGYHTSYYPTTPMLNDIAAIQWLYGANTGFHTENNTYSWQAGKNVYETIWDAGGTDTISAFSQTMGCVLNLNSGQWSQIGAAFYNGQANVRDCLTIAYGSVIENAMGSNYADTLIGNAVTNTLTGNNGNDNLQGMGGNDILKGGSGNDTLDGGGGTDQANYSSATGAVTVSLLTGTATGADGSDTLLNVESITGSAFADTLTGNDSNNVLTGLAGADTLVAGLGVDVLYGGLGNDSLDGGAGIDTVNYGNATGAVTVSLVTGVASGAEDTDTLVNIENVTGSAFNDSLSAGAGRSVLIGGAGNDTLDGGSGSDNLQGGVGNDTYLHGRGYDADTIVENDNTAGNTDILQFGSGVAVSQLWFKHQANNLEVSIIGTAHKVLIKDWYLGSAYRIEQFKAAGETLLSTNVENLVTAMAAFASRPAGTTTLTAAEHAALDSTIAVSWS